MFNHILLATDFSPPLDKLVDRLDFFYRFGARRITLLFVRRVGYPSTISPTHIPRYRELLDEMAVQLREQKWEVDLRLEEGRPGIRIPEVADEVDADLIALANHGHSNLEEVILGSVATEVLEHASAPVFLFSSLVDGDILGETLVHPTDFSKAADQALSMIPNFFSQHKPRVILVHAREEGSKISVEEARQKLVERRDVLTTMGIKEITIEVSGGRPRKVVAEAADRYPEALFMMGSRGLGWLEDLMLGGVSRTMARKGSHHIIFVPDQTE